MGKSISLAQRLRPSRRKFIAMAGAAAAAGLAALPVRADSPILLKLAHDSPLDFPYQPAAEWFKEQVESKTGGRISVQIFPNAQLGDEATMINGLSIGSVDAMYLSTAPLSEAVSDVDLFSLPFIFKDVDHALRVANGPLTKDISAKIKAAVGATVAGWGSVGERDMWNSKRPIHTVADVKGLKMRVQQSPIQQATYSALGALPTPMAFSELYTALQTGVVDGADNGPLDVETGKYYQVTKYLTETKHFILLTPMIISDSFLAKVTPEDQQVLLDVGRASCDIITSKAKEQNTSALAQLKDQGIQIFQLTDADRQEFVDRVQQVYTDNAEKIGGMDLIKRVLATE
jgi:tripartite ATP-independent transporter DctP family solute receptor